MTDIIEGECDNCGETIPAERWSVKDDDAYADCPNCRAYNRIKINE